MLLLWEKVISHRPIGVLPPDVAATIDRLTEQHRRIDPLLEEIDRAFAEDPFKLATPVIADLAVLLDAHLAVEEAEIVPLIREARQFPPPPDDAGAEMYANGFAWSAHGIASDVLEKVFAMLPENVRSRMPAARAAFDARCERAWGTAKAGSSRTAVPGVQASG